MDCLRDLVVGQEHLTFPDVEAACSSVGASRPTSRPASATPPGTLSQILALLEQIKTLQTQILAAVLALQPPRPCSRPGLTHPDDNYRYPPVKPRPSLAPPHP